MQEARGRRFESCHGNEDLATELQGTVIHKYMTISEKEIREDFSRFIRHEAMRANIRQENVLTILKQQEL